MPRVKTPWPIYATLVFLLCDTRGETFVIVTIITVLHVLRDCGTLPFATNGWPLWSNVVAIAIAAVLLCTPSGNTNRIPMLPNLVGVVMLAGHCRQIVTRDDVYYPFIMNWIDLL